MLGYLAKNVQIELIRRSSLVRIAARSPDPIEASAIANTYADTAVESVIALNKEDSENAVVWLKSQASAQRETLRKAETEILEFRKENQMEALEAQRKTAEEAMLAYNKELTAAVAARDALLSRYTSNHPEVKAQVKTIEAMQKQLNNEIDRARKLERQVAECEARLNALQRDKEACEISYKGILRRMEEARLSADENTATIRIVETAEAPSKPVSPRRTIILLLAMILGPSAGCALAMLTYRLEDRIWSTNDVTDEIGLKILGLVPHVDRSNRKRLALMSFTDKFSPIAESFAGIRGMLDSSQPAKTLLVTSSLPNEGKTICSSNLAIMSAKSGIKTLLVDIDMRRPCLHQICSISSSKANLLSTLSDESTPDFSLLPQPTDVPNLKVVVNRHTGQLSPAEILGSRRVQAFIDWAAQNYERVIIDSPPVMAASDSVVVGGAVDGVILVCCFYRSRKSMAKGAVQQLEDGGATILGAIVNDVRFDKMGYASSFGRYSSGYHSYRKSNGVH